MGADSHVLDVGCGRAELLLRIVERHGCHGLGVDDNASGIEYARSQAARRLRSGSLELVVGAFDAGRVEPGSMDLLCCLGAEHAVNPDVGEALGVCAQLVKPGGQLLFATGCWRRDPDAEYLEFLGMAKTDQADHAGNIAIAEAHGLNCLREHEATLDEFAHYEDTYAANMLRYLAEHPDDPDAEAMHERITTWREAYLNWGHDTLGFGLYLFEVPKGGAQPSA